MKKRTSRGWKITGVLLFAPLLLAALLQTPPGKALVASGLSGILSGSDNLNVRIGTVTGWIPGDALGKIFVPEEMDPFRPTCRIDATPRDPDVELLETREGGVMGVFPYSKSGAPLQLLGPPARGVAPVHYRGNGFQATGFMEQLYILPASNVTSGFGVACGTPRNSVFMLLPAGTCLYNEKNGMPVGVLTGDHHAAVTGLDDGWWHVPQLYSPWRLFDLWVQDDGPAPSRGHRMNDRPVVYRHLLSYLD